MVCALFSLPSLRGRIQQDEEEDFKSLFSSLFSFHGAILARHQKNTEEKKGAHMQDGWPALKHSESPEMSSANKRAFKISVFLRKEGKIGR